MLDQFYFSSLVKDFLGKNFPEFLNNVNDFSDSSFECSLENPTQQFSIWIASCHCEVTFGLESTDGNSDCHTHFTPYMPEDIPTVFQNLARIIDDVKSNRLCFYRSSRRGYSWTSDIAETLAEKKAGEHIRFFSWDGNIDCISDF